MSVQPITSKQQFDQLISGDKVVLVDFWATWCGPCRMISPVFEELARKNSVENVEFYKVDVDDLPDVAQEVGIRAMPTFIAFNRGVKVDELVGANPGRLTALVQKGVSLV